MERQNRTTKGMILAGLKKDQTKWFNKLSSIRMAINTRASQSTRYSPFQIVYGRPMRLPSEVPDHPLLQEETPDLTAEEFQLLESNLEGRGISAHVEALQKIHDRLFAKAADNIEKSQAKQREGFARRRRGGKKLEVSI